MPPRNRQSSETDWGDLGFTAEEMRAMQAPTSTPPVVVQNRAQEVPTPPPVAAAPPPLPPSANRPGSPPPAPAYVPIQVQVEYPPVPPNVGRNLNPDTRQSPFPAGVLPAALIGIPILVLAFAIFSMGSYWNPPVPPPATPSSVTSTPTQINGRAESVISNTTQRVWLRNAPSLSGDQITLLAPGTSVVVTGHTNTGWVKVETDAGSGFVFGGYISSPSLPFRPGRDSGGSVVVMPDGTSLRPAHD